MQELIRALGVLVEEPSNATRGVAEALGLERPPTRDEHADLFLFQLYPYASVYLGPEGMLGGEARGRVAGFWRAVGRDVPDDPDHLGALLGLLAALADAEDAERDPARRALIRRARAAALWEHVLPWMPPFLARVAELGASPYRRWAALLAGALRGEAQSLPSPALSAHLAEAPPLPDPRAEGGEDFASGLLAPVRAGFVLTRDDLAGLARAADLGLRRGERRWVLKALLSQDAAATLEGLAREAERQAERMAAEWGELGELTAFWTGRARDAARLLTALAAEPAHPGAPA